MTRLPRLARETVLLVACAILSSVDVSALEPSQWRNRQSLPITHPGVIKIALPPSTLDACRPELVDLRLVDPAGRETPYLLDYATITPPPSTRAPESFRTTLNDRTTEIVVTTGTAHAIAALRITTPTRTFLKPAKVELSDDGEHWTLLRSGVPLFRQDGAEQLEIDLDRKSAAYVRLTIDDSQTPAIPFTRATVLLQPTNRESPAAPLPEARISHREEFAGQSLLTIDLGARNVPIVKLTIGATDALFARRVSIAVRELRDGTASERTVASGTIYRLQSEGMPSTAELDLPTSFTTPTRELFVHIENGDSPPLTIDRFSVQQRPTWLLFNASTPGPYTLLTGNPDVVAPRYDLATFSPALRTAVASTLPAGPVEPNPGYQRPDALAETLLLGGPIDPADWRFRRPVQLTAPGIQELELNLDVLAETENGLADLRLVQHGTQVPYLVERPNLSRALALTMLAITDPKHPTVSRWQVALPHAELPLTRLTLTSSSTLFQRHLRVFERISSERDGESERTLAEADWNHSPGNLQPLVLNLVVRPTTTTLIVETDNGDNPSLPLGRIQGSYPVTRLLFKTNSDPLDLYYGNRMASPPRYDIALVAAQLLAADKHIATLGPEESASSAGWAQRVLGSAHAGVVFWGALALVVVALLIVVAKLLPKPPPPAA